MFPHLQEQWKDRDSGNFELQDIKDFPYDKWQLLKQTYQEAEAWFTGEKLEKRNTNNIELYPLKINPIINTCLKHAYILFGEPQDDGRPQVYPKLTSTDKTKKDQIARAEEVLNLVWSQSSGRAMLMEGGILSQIYGGAILKVNWDGANRDKDNPLSQIGLESVPAPSFYGIPHPSNYYRLKHAWIIKKLEDVQAAALGYTPVANEDNWFVEYWDEAKFYQQINGQILEREVNGQIKPFAGRNPWGFVPIVYVPHVRVGTFIGINTFNHVLGLVKEINLRYADYGDAVNDDSHANLAGRNISSNPQIKEIGGGLNYIDLGSSRNLTGNEPEPDLFEVSKSNKASTAMKDLTDVLYEQYRRDAAHPSVADGEDEGSQRSGLTIAMRFWPMTSHVGIERYFWTPALNQINGMILKILAKKKKAGITTEHTKFLMKQKWAPELPRDREADVQEWTQRAANNIGAIETLLEATGDIDDVQGERQLILDWIKDVAKIEAEVAAEAAQKFPPPVAPGGDGKSTNPKQKDSKKKSEQSDKTKPNSD